MEEIDIWRTATLLMKQHGAEAGIIAATRAEALHKQGDHEGCAVWINIWKSIDALRRRKPREGEAVN
jgi:hypothetical protein